jgi:hypothetical protein
MLGFFWDFVELFLSLIDVVLLHLQNFSLAEIRLLHGLREMLVGRIVKSIEYLFLIIV